MNGRLNLLAGLLIAQLLLLVGFIMLDQPAEQVAGLLEVAPADVTKLTIADGEGATVELQRTDAGWQLAGGAGADGAKVDGVLERLAGMKSLWPVAATESSQTRFEVADEHFQRRLQLTGNGVDQVVYLGSSPGYRRVHARNQASDDIFSIEFSDFELPADPSEWLDKNQLRAKAISSVTLADGWTLSADGERWEIDGGPADVESAATLIQRLEGMQLLGVFSGDPQTLGSPRTLEVVDAQGSYQLTLRHDPQADNYVLESSRVAGSFTVASYIIEQILVDAAVLAPRVDVKLAPPAETTATDASGV